MPQGKGTYGSKKGRPPKRKKEDPLRKKPDTLLYLKKIQDSIKAKKVKPDGRSIAAMKAAGVGPRISGRLNIRTGKGNPAGKDLSIRGRMKAITKKLKPGLGKALGKMGKKKK